MAKLSMAGRIWRAELGIPQDAPVSTPPPHALSGDRHVETGAGISKSAAARVTNTILAQYGDLVKDVAYGYLRGDASGVYVEVTLKNGNRLIGRSGREVRALLAVVREEQTARYRATVAAFGAAVMGSVK